MSNLKDYLLDELQASRLPSILCREDTDRFERQEESSDRFASGYEESQLQEAGVYDLPR